MPKNAQRFGMVDTTRKKEVLREAVAIRRIKLKPYTIGLIMPTRLEDCQFAAFVAQESY